MQAISLAQRGYSPNSGAIHTPRSIEFQVIARITHRLKNAVKAGDKRTLIEAMHENRMLWNALATDVASSENELPDELRARIFYLAEFTAIHTQRVLKDEADAAPLLEINAAILGGLQSEGQQK